MNPGLKSGVAIYLFFLFTVILLPVILPPTSVALAISEEERAMRQFKFAFGLFKEGEMGEAINQFEKLISFHRRFSKIDLACFLLGESYFKKGEFDKALDSYNQVVRHHSGSEVAPDARLAVGWCLYRLERYPEAREALETALKTDQVGKTVPEANFLLGEINLFNKDYAAAIPHYAEVRGNYPESPNHAEAVFKESLCLLKTGKYNEAAEGFKGFAEKSVNSPLFDDALYNLAEATYLSGKYDEAIDYYEKVLKIGRTDRLREPSLYSIAFAYFKKGDFARSRENFLKLTGSASKDMAAEASIRAAKCLYSLGRYAEASAELEKVSRDYGESRFAAEAALTAGMSLYKAGKYGEAAAAFERTSAAFAGTPEGVSSIQLQGASLFSGEKYAEAITAFRRFREKTDDRKKAMDASLRIADSLFNLKKYKESVDEYLGVLEKYPDLATHDQIYFSVGETWYLMGNLAKASEYYRLSAEVPDSRFRADGLYRAAVAAERSGSDDKALEMYLSVADELKGKNLEDQARLKASVLLMNRKKYADAIGHLDKIIANEGSKQIGDALLMKGNCLKMARRFPEAETAYRALINGHPEAGELFDSARQGLAYSLFMQKNYDDAVNEYRYVVDHYPDSSLVAEAQYWIGKSFFMKGDYKSAVTEYLKVTILYPESANAPYALFKIGESKSKLGQPSEALKNYEKLVERYPGSDLVALARENISRIKGNLKDTLSGSDPDQQAPTLPGLEEASGDGAFDSGKSDSQVPAPDRGAAIPASTSTANPAGTSTANPAGIITDITEGTSTESGKTAESEPARPADRKPVATEAKSPLPAWKTPAVEPTPGRGSKNDTQPATLNAPETNSGKAPPVSFEDLGKALMQDIENLIDNQNSVKGPEEN